MDSSVSKDPLALVHISFYDEETGEETRVALDAAVFVGLLHVTKTWGIEHAHALLLFGASLVKPEITGVESRRLHLALTALQRYVAQWDDPAELALAITYEQLRTSQITDEQAAIFAAALLDKPMRSDRWRKRVEGWVAKQGLPPLAGDT